MRRRKRSDGRHTRGLHSRERCARLGHLVTAVREYGRGAAKILVGSDLLFQIPIARAGRVFALRNVPYECLRHARSGHRSYKRGSIKDRTYLSVHRQTEIRVAVEERKRAHWRPSNLHGYFRFF